MGDIGPLVVSACPFRGRAGQCRPYPALKRKNRPKGYMMRRATESSPWGRVRGARKDQRRSRGSWAGKTPPPLAVSYAGAGPFVRRAMGAPAG